MSAPAAKAFLHRLEPELRPIDILVDKWARETMNRAPIASNAIARAMAEAEGAALPGGDEFISLSTELIDRVIARSPARTQALLHVWYRSGTTSDDKAKRLGISRAALYVQWKAALWYVRGGIVTAGIDMSGV